MLAVGSGLLATFIPVATGVLYDSVIPSANRTLLFQMVAGLAVGSFVAAMFQIVQGLAQLRFGPDGSHARSCRLGSPIESAGTILQALFGG